MTQKNNQKNQKDDESIDERDKRVYNINIKKLSNPSW